MTLLSSLGRLSGALKSRWVFEKDLTTQPKCEDLLPRVEKWFVIGAKVALMITGLW